MVSGRNVFSILMMTACVVVPTVLFAAKGDDMESTHSTARASAPAASSVPASPSSSPSSRASTTRPDQRPDYGFANVGNQLICWRIDPRLNSKKQ